MRFGKRFSADSFRVGLSVIEVEDVREAWEERVCRQFWPRRESTPSERQNHPGREVKPRAGFLGKTAPTLSETPRGL